MRRNFRRIFLRLLCLQFLTDRGFELLLLFLLPVFSAEDIHENICKTSITVHHIFEPFILTKGVHIGIDRNPFGPCLVVMGDSPIPFFLPDGVDQNKCSPGQTVLRHYLMDCFVAKGVVLIVTGNRPFNLILAGDVQFVGLTIPFQIALLERNGRRLTKTLKK